MAGCKQKKHVTCFASTNVRFKVTQGNGKIPGTDVFLITSQHWFLAQFLFLFCSVSWFQLRSTGSGERNMFASLYNASNVVHFNVKVLCIAGWQKRVWVVYSLFLNSSKIESTRVRCESFVMNEEEKSYYI